MDYNYYDEVRDSLVDYIDDYDWKEMVSEGYTYDDIHERLYDDAFCSDSVTGNGSGSYFCNAYRAEEALAHNWDVLEEALYDFGNDRNPIEEGAEWCDCIIRCYVMSQVFDEAMEECGVKVYIDEYEEENGDDDEG